MALCGDKCMMILVITIISIAMPIIAIDLTKSDMGTVRVKKTHSRSESYPDKDLFIPYQMGLTKMNFDKEDTLSHNLLSHSRENECYEIRTMVPSNKRRNAGISWLLLTLLWNPTFAFTYIWRPPIECASTARWMKSFLHYNYKVSSTLSCMTNQHRRPYVENEEESTMMLRQYPMDQGLASTTGLYIHIPFCRRRCRYCDFAIVPIGSIHANDWTAPSLITMNHNYTVALLRELDRLNEQNRDCPKILLTSIYFGGGTPSLAPVETLQTILSTILDPLFSPFCIDETNCEITIEMDPGTFSQAKLEAIHRMGFNRISLGVQSFDDMILEALGRTHRCKDIDNSLTMIQQVFGEKVNYSIDLISGLPGQSLAMWMDTLERVVHLKPQPKHLSIYDLQVEPGTVFGTWYTGNSDKSTSAAPFMSTRGEALVSQNFLPLPSEENAAFMYKYASGYLRSKGYEHYEVSSYALLSQPFSNDSLSTNCNRSRHNQIYWDLDGHWYALGLGATSFVHGQLIARPRALADYCHWVENDQMESHCSNESMDQVSKKSLLQDIVLKRLRTSEGLPLDWVEQKFGRESQQAVLRGAQLGMDLNLAFVEAFHLRLVDPDGFLYSNSIISNIFAELEDMLCVAE